jgi:hypothetical protein
VAFAIGGNNVAKDLTGQRFGRLFVLRASDLPKPEANGNRLGWLCRCDCGNEVIRSNKALRLSNGKVKSCGCLLRETAVKKVVEDNAMGHYDGTTVSAIAPDRNKNKNNTSGVKGVYWSASEKKWVAKIGFRNKTITLGRYVHKDDAIKARKEAEEKYFTPVITAYNTEGKKQ